MDYEYEVVATIHRTRLKFLFWQWCVDTRIAKRARDYIEATSLRREVTEMVGEAIGDNPNMTLTVSINRIR